MNRSNLQPTNHTDLASHIMQQYQQIMLARRDLSDVKRYLDDIVVRLKHEFNYKAAGSNNAERDQALADHLLTETQAERGKVIEAEDIVESLQAELEGMLALRRGMEWDTRSALTDAVIKAGVTTNHRNSQQGHVPQGDIAFDDLLDEVATLRTEVGRLKKAVRDADAASWNDIVTAPTAEAAEAMAMGVDWSVPPPPEASEDIAALAFGDYSGQG